MKYPVASALILAMVAAPCAASAGTIVYLERYDYVRVQISVGNNTNPNNNPVIFDGSVQRGWTYHVASAQGLNLCVRRTGRPGDPSSGLSNWTCTSNDDTIIGADAPDERFEVD